jgi:hypothetical protein
MFSNQRQSSYNNLNKNITNEKLQNVSDRTNLDSFGA